MLIKYFFAFALLLAAALPLGAAAQTSLPEDKSSAVILAYHRVGEDSYPGTNLRMDQFEAHLKALTSGSYNVLSVKDILSALNTGEALPARTLAITFEGAYRSAYENAMPLLIEHNIPFTVFFASNHADSDAQQHISWKDIKELARHKNVSFGLHPAAYTRLADQSPQDILSQINKARVRYRDHLKTEPQLFSYPFGEYSLAYKNLIKEQEFIAAFGQQSGAISAASDAYALPRFTMTGTYGDMERFTMLAHALPLPVSASEPEDPYLSAPQSGLGFTVTEALATELPNLSCFVSGQEQPAIEVLGQTRIELRFAEPITESRTRVNCTLPGPVSQDDTPSWRWFSMMFVFDENENENEPSPEQEPGSEG